MTTGSIETPNAPAPVANYAQGRLFNGTLYAQGVIALDPETGRIITGDITAQSERVFRSIRAILTEAGLSLADVLVVRAYLRDLSDYAGFNAVYNQLFHAKPYPVRTTVQARLPFDALVEVEVIAARESPGSE